MNVSALRLTLPSVIIALATTALTLLRLPVATVPITYAAPPIQISDSTLRIVNDSDQTICDVFISSVTADSWGDDWLGENETIPPGASASFDLPQGDYDVFLADCEDNQLLDERGITISELYELRFTGPDVCEASNREGVALYHQARYHDALLKFQDALTCYREMDDHKGEGILLHNIGMVYGSLGQYEQALMHYEEALAIAREIGDRAGEGVTLNNTGNVYDSLGEYERALGYFEEALNIAREIGDRAEQGVTLNNIGMVYDSLGQYEQALAYYEEALTILQEIGERAGEGTTLNNIGLAYHHLGQYEQAVAYYGEALTILQKIGDRATEAVTLNNIGGVHDGLGQYERALAHYEEALMILQEIGDRAGEAVTLNNIGTVYNALGQYERALAYYEEALRIRRDIGDRAGEGDTLSNVGVAYQYLEQYEQALAHYEEALTIRRDIGDQSSEGITLNNIGLVYYNLGRHEQALEYYEEALTIQRKIGDRAGEGVTLSNIGLAHQHLGQYEQALAHCEEALTIRRQIGDRAGEAVTLNNIGTVYDRLGRYERALDYFEQAVAAVEATRGEMTVEDFKSGFAAKNLSPYHWIVHLLVEMNRPADAFHYVQRAKARTLLDQLGNARLDPLITNNPRLVEEEETLRAEIQALDAQLREEWTKPPEHRSEEAIRSLEAQLEERRDAYTQLLVRIKLENPEYASLVAIDTLTLTQTQQLLTDTTLVEYYVLPAQTLAFVVTTDSFHVEPISVTKESLYDEIRKFHLESQGTLVSVPTSVRRLHDVLIVPIAAYLSTQQLLIAPHDILHYVPFSALYDGNDYLIEQYTLAQLPSASIVPFILKRRQAFGGPPLILGDPDGSLPFGRREAEAVAELYDTTAHIGDDALERLVWEQGPEAGILHLATHGVYNQRAPLFSRLLLAAGTEEEHDGVLEVREVYNLNLGSADLVVLSACQTNLGEQSAGDEIVGLNRAFIYAGTPSVLASLWSVDDAATGELMVAFYRYLREGQPKGEALRRAQMDLLENPATAHPYYWAGFVLTGDAGPPAEIRHPGSLPAGASKWLLALGSSGGCCACILVVLLLGLVVGMFVRRRKQR